MRDLFSEKIKPMLAHSSKPFNDKNWIVELKYDGTRTIAYVDTKKKFVKLLNRRLTNFTSRYPEIKKGLLDAIDKRKVRKIILDGEIVVLNEKGIPDFYKLSQREHITSPFKIEIYSKSMPATYILFDVLYLNGKDITSVELIERKKILESVIKENSFIIISEIFDGKYCKKIFQRIKKTKFEGIVLKKKDSKYIIGKRSHLWLKVKTLNTIDCIILGYTEGSGWRKEFFGALVLGVYYNGKLKYIGKVGTGWSVEDLKLIKKMMDKVKTKRCPFKEVPEDLRDEKIFWLKPKLVCEVEYLEFSKGMELRAPSFKRLRNDKDVKECILEL